MMKKRIRYTTEQIEFLRAGYMSMNIRDLTPAFNAQFGAKKTEVRIKSALSNHRILCGRKQKDRLIQRVRMYTPEQVRFIRNNYTGRSVKELTSVFNTKFEVNMTTQQIKTFVHNRGITSGRTGHFKKGNMPWNTGTKGLTSANVTSFQKGNIPANRKPIGSERICPKDGYILIKVAERNPQTGSPTRYKHKQVYIWEQANGPVPAGMVVAFRDSDKLKVEIDNLMLISRAELLRLNKHGYKGTPVELKPSVLALSKLETKTFGMTTSFKGEHGNNNTDHTDN